MLTAPPSRDLDILLVGGLTIDRFADGAVAPGGTVMHAARAAARHGLAVGVATACGPEPVAQSGLAELRELTTALLVTPAPTTATFRHAEDAGGRRLWLEAPAHAVSEGDVRELVHRAAAVLAGPVHDEVTPATLSAVGGAGRCAAILQGWLRAIGREGEIVPLALGSISPPLRDAVAGLDLLVVSREDLAADAGAPSDQLLALRETVGPGPCLVLTSGTDGLWFEDGRQAEHVPVPAIVADVSTVGAGDVLSAFLIGGAPATEPGWRARAAFAMRIVAAELEVRRR